MSVFQVRDAKSLVSAVNSASGGDRIELLPGTYNTVYLKGARFDSEVTITSANAAKPALIEGRFIIENGRNVTLDGLDFETNSLPNTQNKFRLYVRDSEDITLKNLDMEGYIVGSEGRDARASGTDRNDPIKGYAHDTAIRIGGSKNVEIVNVEAQDYRKAMIVAATDNVTIRNVDIHDVREGINFYEVTGMTVTNSYFHDFQPWLAMRDPQFDSRKHDHPDMIQYWGRHSVDGVHDITIADNIFQMRGGESTQTIFGHMRNGSPGATASDFEVTGNVILNHHPNAIYLGDVKGALVEDNFLLGSGAISNTSWAPKIKLPRASDVEVKDNVQIEARGGTIAVLSDRDLARQNIELSGNTRLSNDASEGDSWQQLLKDYSLQQLKGGLNAKVGSGDAAGGNAGGGAGGQSGGSTGGSDDASGGDTGGNGGGTSAPSGGGKFSFNGRDYAVRSFKPGEQDKGGHKVADGGDALKLTGNSWKFIDADVNIGAGSVLSFDFAAGTGGELHGIGFANGGRYGSKQAFIVAGSDDWGVKSGDWRYDGRGTDHFDIPVGEYLRGDFDRIVFIGDDDARGRQSSTISDVSLKKKAAPQKPAPDKSEEDAADKPGAGDGGQSGTSGLKMDGKSYGLSAFDTRLQGEGEARFSDGGKAVTLSDNAWMAIDRDVVLTRDSTLSFDFSMADEAEINGIGFARGNSYGKNTVFKLAGDQDWGMSDADWAYAPGSGKQRIDIDVGEHLTGRYDQILLVADDDAGIGGDSTFANITLG